MKKTELSKVLGLTAAVLLSACSSNDVVEEPPAEVAEVPVEVVEVEEAPVTEEVVSTVEPVELTAEELEAQTQSALLDITTFYFDYDESSIKSDAKSALVAHAKYLAANPSVSVKLEGHADERGTPEYNLALGERRAVAVRRFLMANGAAASQISVVSFGEERPVMRGHSESSWAKNRRVVVNY